MKAVKDLQSYILESGGQLPRFGVDGDLGGETKTAIDSLRLPKYLKVALKEVGTKEYAGSADNPDIVKYHSTTAGKYKDDEVPWCGSFVNWVMLQDGHTTVKFPERAKAWADFGIGVDEPLVGSIAVKSRRGGGHVCLVIGKTKDGYLLCVGGNQNDAVNIKKYHPSAFFSFRVPNNYTSNYTMHRYALAASSAGREA